MYTYILYTYVCICIYIYIYIYNLYTYIYIALCILHHKIRNLIEYIQQLNFVKPGTVDEYFVIYVRVEAVNIHRRYIWVYLIIPQAIHIRTFVPTSAKIKVRFMLVCICIYMYVHIVQSYTRSINKHSKRYLQHLCEQNCLSDSARCTYMYTLHAVYVMHASCSIYYLDDICK